MSSRFISAFLVVFLLREAAIFGFDGNTVETEDVKYGLPGNGSYLSKSGFKIGFNNAYKIPSWGYYVINSSMESVYRHRYCETVVDDGIDSTWQANDDDFRHTGYNRRHLIPGGQFQQAKYGCDAYVFSNVFPHKNIYNGGAMTKIQVRIKKYAFICEKVYVSNGVAFIPKEEESDLTGSAFNSQKNCDNSTCEARKSKLTINFIGKSKVAVPTHVFHSVICECNAKAAMTINFLASLSEPCHVKNLDDYVVPKAKIEHYTGLKIFPKAEGIEESSTAFIKCH